MLRGHLLHVTTLICLQSNNGQNAVEMYFSLFNNSILSLLHEQCDCCIYITIGSLRHLNIAYGTHMYVYTPSISYLSKPKPDVYQLAQVFSSISSFENVELLIKLYVTNFGLDLPKLRVFTAYQNDMADLFLKNLMLSNLKSASDFALITSCSMCSLQIASQ